MGVLEQLDYAVEPANAAQRVTQKIAANRARCPWSASRSATTSR